MSTKVESSENAATIDGLQYVSGIDFSEPQDCKKEYVESICDNCDFRNSRTAGHPGGSSYHSADWFWCDWGHWEDGF